MVYYKIFDPVISITNIRDAGWGTRLLAQTMLRNVLGTHSLGEAMTNREVIAAKLQVLSKKNESILNNCFIF